MSINAPGQARREILNWLKYKGPQDAAVLARRLKVSAMAVRQHLYALRDEKLVDFDLETRPKGRPAKLWRLTIDANRFFPDAHSELVVELVSTVRGAFGEEGLRALLATRARKHVESYLTRMPKPASSLRKRVEALAELRTGEGYMAEVQEQRDGTLLLVENHCSICIAANTCSSLCDSELEMFRSVLGQGVRVDREEHILAGHRRCTYRVSVIRKGKS